MDATAGSLCQNNSIPILVFNMTDPQNSVRVIQGEETDIGPLIARLDCQRILSEYTS